MSSDVNWLSLLYACMAIVSGSFNARIWWDAVADYRWAEAATDVRPARLLTALDQLTLHSFLLAVQIVFLIVGMVSFAFPPISPAPPPTLSRVLVIAGLILIEVMLASAAIITRINWRRILRIIERQNERRETA